MPTVETRESKSGTRFVVRVRNPDVRPRQRGLYTSATFATRAEAERFARDCDDRGVSWALAEYRRGKEEDQEMTLDQWAEVHFSSITGAAPAQVKRYRSIYARHWSPHLGHMRLSTIERPHVAAALLALPATDRDKTKKNKWAVLSDMLKKAVADGHLSRSPHVGVKLARLSDHETEEHRYLTHAEFFQVLYATPEHWRPLVMTLAGTGMRWGEAAALTVGDIDTEARAIRVTKAEKQDPENPGQTFVGPVKSRKSRRTITIPDEVLHALLPLLEDRKRTERLFLPPRGGPLRHRTFYRDIWLKHSCGKSDIAEPYPRLHDLRHTHVAWLIAAGTPLPVIQARLGHEKITTTIDTYGHLLPDLQRAAADAAGQVFASRGISAPMVAGELA